MKTPKRIEPLVEDGLIDEVLRPLMSGKEAAVYVVRCGNRIALRQGLQGGQQTQFPPGGGVSGRPQGAQQPRCPRHGKRQPSSVAKRQEEAWQNAEVAALYRLAGAGVRVPKPYDFLDGVLLMELVADDDRRCRAAPQRCRADARAGPRVPRVHDPPDRADALRRAGARRPVRVQRAARPGPARSSSTCRRRWMRRATTMRSSMLERDVGNMASYFGRFAPELEEDASMPRKCGRCTKPASCTRAAC